MNLIIRHNRTACGLLYYREENNSISNSPPVLMSQHKFKPGSIHEAGRLSFWENDLKAGTWVMDVIKNGYVIPFEYPPPAYEEDNNSTAKKEMAFVRQAIYELKEVGVVEFVHFKPTCVSPLTVSQKTQPDGSKKQRLCWDGSRCVNLALKKQHVTLSHLQKALEITKEGDFQIVYDLTSAFHHIKIHDKQTQYLGASFVTEENEKIYFIFLYLPFGLGTAVHCITKMFKPLNAYFHGMGIRHTIFINDGRGLAESKEAADEIQKSSTTPWIRQGGQERSRNLTN